MKLLNFYSIKVRLIISATLAFAGMLIITTQSITQTKQVLLSEKQQQTKHLVEAAYSLIDARYQDFKAGKITEQAAQQAAINEVMLIRYDNNNYFWINNEKAEMVAHAVKPSLNGKDLSKLEDPNGKFLFVEFVNLIKKTPQGGVVDYLWEKPGEDTPVEKISYVKGFTPWGWIIGTGIYIDDVEDTMLASVQDLLVNVAIITVLILVLLFFIAKSIITPINNTSRALANLAQGEGDLTQRLAINGKDEIADLAQSFNQFMEKIHHIIEQVQDSAKAVKHASINLSDLSHDALQSNEQQNVETSQIATASNQMLSTITEIANNANTASQLAETANNNANNSKSIVNNSLQSVQELSTEIKGASLVISELNNECATIDSVLSVIKAIAEQTNLLALNAAIEAARAGEQGRGFAVVADEVRTLAGRTQVATLEINDIIAQLQTKANEAVDVFSRSENIADNAVVQANDTYQSLELISTSVTAIADANHQIATAADEQSNVTREIDERVTAISSLSEQTTKRSEEINKGNENVSQLGIELRELIKTFKV